MNREQFALVLTVALALPLVYGFGRAVSEGTVRHRETPLRAMLSDARFEALRDGDRGFPHYLGDSLRAPDFTLRDAAGREHSLRSRRGRVVVLNFWSITCPPCLEELPSVDELARVVSRFGDVDVWAISTDDTWDEVRPLLPRDAAATYLLDPTNEVVTGRFGTRLYPETWIIDRDGVVRLRYDGAFDWSSSIAFDVIDSFR